MAGNTHMPNLNFPLQTILTYFPETKCGGDAGPIDDPSQLSDTSTVTTLKS